LFTVVCSNNFRVFWGPALDNSKRKNGSEEEEKEKKKLV
jgi:hypothetical protein